MDKVKIKLPSREWGTLKTKYPANSRFVSPDEFTDGSKNFDTDVKGVITKRKGGVNYNATAFANPAKDQYEAIFSDGTHHLLVVQNGTWLYSSGDGAFNSVTNGTGFSTSSNFEFASYLDRVYAGNGVDASQVYDKTASYGGVGYTVPRLKAMGAQAPTGAATAAVGGAGNVPAGSYNYAVTFLYYDFEESNGGPDSNTVVPGVASMINLTSVPIGGYGVTARKIYRQDTALPGIYRLVGTISDNTTTIFTDNTATGGALIPDDNNTPPLFKYVVQNLDRLWVAGITGDPSAVQFSAAGLPDVYPVDNFILCNTQDYITGLVVFNDKVVVFHRSSFGQILGNSADTFRYEQVPGNIGCVDNRTIQIRIIEGVPVLVWLSDKGFYSFDGSNINYLSDAIENISNNNQQASLVRGSNTQTSQSDFQGGTSSPSINLLLSSGDITQANPKKIWDEQTEFEESGFVGVNVVTRDGSGVLKAPIRYAPTYASGGSHNNTVESSGSLTLAAYSPTSASDSFSGGTATTPGPTLSRIVGVPFQFAISGIITSATISDIITSNIDSPTSANYTQTYGIKADNSGVPGAVLYSTNDTITGGSFTGNKTISPNLQILANTTYWLYIEVIGTSNPAILQLGLGSSPVNSYGAVKGSIYTSGSYSFYTTTVAGITQYNFNHSLSLTAAQNAVSGQWVSTTYDTGSLLASPTSIIHTGSFPITFGATTSSISYVEGSSDGTTFDVSQSFNSLNGTGAVSLASRRYWRIRLSLATNDNRVYPTLGAVQIRFPTTATWTSAAVDHTTDITALNALTATTTTPSGTSVTLEIATSSDNISYSPFTAIGSATPLRYSKVRVTITTTAINDATATADDITLTWTVVGNLVSSAIDTGTTAGPAGWDIFQSSFTGSVVFEMRSAATIGGLTAATYFTVTHGAFPSSVPLNKFVQWRATLTAVADTVPVVSSVVISWFISATTGLRAASIFYNKNYYVALAESGQTTNNIVLVFDQFAKWRIYRGINIATLSYFFNEPYYGNALEGRIVRFLQTVTNTDQGTNIEMDVRTKAFDLDDETKRKIIAKVFITGIGTGATYTPTYSTDNGQSFKSLVNSAGSASFTTTNDGLPFTERLVPQSADDYNGQTLLIRLHNNDAFSCEIHEINWQAWLRNGDIL